MKKKIHYSWLILAGCCMLQGAGIGIVNNCSGLFYNSVSKAIGCAYGSISVYSTIANMTSCFVMLFMTKMLQKVNNRLLLTLGAVCTGLPCLLLSVCGRLWQWYALAAVQGFGLAFTTNLIAPIILNSWFKKRVGLAVGLSTSMGGIFGTIVSALLGPVINGGAWRTAYLIEGICCLVITLPMTLFVLAMRPEDKGMTAYGEDEAVIAQKKAVPADNGNVNIYKDPRLYMLIALMIISRVGMGFMPHLSKYGSSVSFTLMDVSILTTMFMLGNMATKLAFGPLNDRLGERVCSLIGLGLVLLAFLLLLTGNSVAVLAGAFLFGSESMFSQLQLSLISRTIFKGAAYTRVMGIMSITNQLSYALAIACIGFAFDAIGYKSVIIIFAVTTVIAMGLALTATKKKAA